jgi:hypothetical protein
MHVYNFQGRHFCLKKESCGDAPQRRQRLGSTICRYSPLIAAKRLVICRYLPLLEFHLPLFADINCRYLLLFAANCN